MFYLKLNIRSFDVLNYNIEKSHTQKKKQKQ